MPTSGSFSASYIGPLEGQLSSTYRVEGLSRFADPVDDSQHFTKYSRLQKLSPLNSEHGHLGFVQLKMVGSGICLTSAVITAFYHAGETAFIPGVSLNEPVSVEGNALALYTDTVIGIFGQLNTNSPVVNTAYLTGASVDVSVLAIPFTSPDSHR